jgi:hypothetical protein
VDQPANAERVRCGRCEAGNGGPSATAKVAADWGGGRVQCGDIAPEGGPLTIDGTPVAEPAINSHRMTEPPSHAGLPVISVPCGFTPEGIPVGMQLIGPHHADAAVLRAGAAYEAATAWRESRPNP